MICFWLVLFLLSNIFKYQKLICPRFAYKVGFDLLEQQLINLFSVQLGGVNRESKHKHLIARMRWRQTLFDDRREKFFQHFLERCDLGAVPSVFSVWQWNGIASAEGRETLRIIIVRYICRWLINQSLWINKNITIRLGSEPRDGASYFGNSLALFFGLNYARGSDTGDTVKGEMSLFPAGVGMKLSHSGDLLDLSSFEGMLDRQ